MSKLEEIQCKINEAVDALIIADSYAAEANGKLVVSIQRFRFDEVDSEAFEHELVEYYKLEKIGYGSGQYGPFNTYETEL